MKPDEYEAIMNHGDKKRIEPYVFIEDNPERAYIKFKYGLSDSHVMRDLFNIYKNQYEKENGKGT